MPYSGPDIGGFNGTPSKELFIRWFQLASFLPFFRTHCAFFLPNREPWEFGAEALNILRGQLHLRYRLLPYWYTLAWQASQQVHPLVRPLFWEDPSDQQLWEIDDAFMVGEGAGTLFSDAGDGYGDHRLDQFKLNIDNEYGYQLTWSTKGEYPFPYEKVKLRLYGFENNKLTQVHLSAKDLENLIEIDAN